MKYLAYLTYQWELTCYTFQHETLSQVVLKLYNLASRGDICCKYTLQIRWELTRTSEPSLCERDTLLNMPQNLKTSQSNNETQPSFNCIPFQSASSEQHRSAQTRVKAHPSPSSPCWSSTSAVLRGGCNRRKGGLRRQLGPLHRPPNPNSPQRLDG
jgi:hypothetical protein